MNIAIASGKGGTGKTTIAMTLATYYAGKGVMVALLDCDVEEPNVNLFLQADVKKSDTASVLVPRVDEPRCTGCGECERICVFSAIVIVRGKPLLFPDMCHSCGGCALVCPEKAIKETEKPTGVIESGNRNGIAYAGGRLNIGEAMSPPLVREVKRRFPDAAVRIIDSPPGTSCPTVEAVRDCDYVVLVAEPTPFGLYDLSLAAGTVRSLGIPFGVAVNRADIGENDIMEQYGNMGYDIIAAIPHSREVAEAYSRGDCVSFILNQWGEEIEKIASRADYYVREGSQT